jgi:hypothetical protein
LSKEIPTLTPDTINRLEAGVAPALALLAGMGLEIFTALATGPATPTVLAQRLGVEDERLSRLLYALVLAELLTHDNGTFANTAETAKFLVKGSPRYIGGGHELTREIWEADLKSAESIRRGAPAAHHDFTGMDETSLAAFLRGILNDDRLSPASGVYLNVTLMNFYPAGRSYTHSENVDWLKAAGCVDPIQVTLRGGSEVICATKT